MDNKVKKKNIETNRQQKARHFYRRRSSSENNLDVRQLSRYLDGSGGIAEDTGKLGIQANMLAGRNSSETDLEYLEKVRTYSIEEDGQVEHSVEDEVERELEAYARKESITLIMDSVEMQNELLRRQMSIGSRAGRDSTSSRRSSADMHERASGYKHRSLAHAVRTDSYRSDDSGGDSKGPGRRPWRLASSTSGKDSPGSVKRKLFAQNEAKSIDDENVFEAELEERARRASLVHMGLDQEESVSESDENILDTDVDGDKDKPLQKELSLRSEVSITVNNDSIDDLDEEIRLSFVNRLHLNIVDDDYLSSSPCRSLTPVSPKPPTKKTTLGMSIDSNDDTEVQDIVMDSITEMTQKDLEELTNVPDYPSARRRSSAFEDLSVLCSDCRALKQKCEECSKLLQGQACLILHEKRLSLTTSPMDDKNFVKSLGNMNGVKAVKQTSVDVGAAVTDRAGAMEDEKVQVLGVRKESVNGCVGNGVEDTKRIKKISKPGRGNRRRISRDETVSFPRYASACDNELNGGKIKSREAINKEIIRKISKEEVNRKLLQNICQEEAKQDQFRRVSRDETYRLIVDDSNGHVEFRDRTLDGLEHENDRKTFLSDKIDVGDLSRQEKVGNWLSSLSHTISMDNEEMSSCQNGLQTLCGPRGGYDHKPRERANTADAQKILRCKPDAHSPDDDEDVFYNAEDRSSQDANFVERPKTLGLSWNGKPGLGKKRANMKALKHLGSTGSEGSSTQKSQKDVHLNKSEPGNYIDLIVKALKDTNTENLNFLESMK